MRADIEPARAATSRMRSYRTDQDRLDQAQPRRFDRAFQRDLVAGMRDGHLDRGLALRRLDQALVFVVRVLRRLARLSGMAASALAARPG